MSRHPQFRITGSLRWLRAFPLALGARALVTLASLGAASMANAQASVSRTQSIERDTTQRGRVADSAQTRNATSASAASVFGGSSQQAPYATDKLTRVAMPVTPTSAPAAMLDGKIAGLSVLRVNGAPGADVLVQLRNQRDFDGRTQPLYLVDGVLLTSLNALTSQDIEALDIEEIEVLKGAVASALYGSRAAGGVIVISTRRGQSLKLNTTQFLLRNEAGRDYNTGAFDATKAHFYRVNAAGEYVNAAGTVVPRNLRVFQPNQIMENRYIVPTYDHADEFFEPGGYNNQTVSLQQRRATNNFGISYSRNRQRGTTPNADGYLRQTARLNANQHVGTRLNVALSVSNIWGNEEPSAASFGDLLLAQADQSLLAKPSVGSFPYNPTLTALFGGATNPLAAQLLADREIVRKRLLSSVAVTYRAASWLSFDVLGSYDRLVQKDTSVENDIDNAGAVQPGRSIFAHDSAFLGWLQGGFRLTKSIGQLASQLAVRSETQREYERQSGGTSRPLTIPGLPGPPPGNFFGSYVERRVRAEVGALNLNYDGKYLIDGVFRQEHLRPTVGKNPTRESARGAAAWMLNRESWLPFQSMSLLKLRYGRGKIERAPTSDGSSFVEGAEFYSAPMDIFWENEYGGDFSVNDRISGSFTYSTSRNRTSLQRAVPSGSVISAPVQLKGVSYEGAVSAHILNRPSGLQWDATLVGSHRRSWAADLQIPTLSRLEDNVLTIIGNGIRPSVIWGQQLVRSMEQLQVMHPASAAAFNTDDLGNVVPVGVGNTFRDGKAKSLWGTFVTVDGQRYPWGLPIMAKRSDFGTQSAELGDMNPDLQFGFQNQLRYKGVRAHLQFAGQLGGDIMNEAKRIGYAIAAHADVDQSGKPDELRKPRQYYQAMTTGVQDAFVESATHLRLAEASLGYALNAVTHPFLRRVGASRVEFDLIGRNLFSTSSSDVLGNSLHQRVNVFQYPRTRTFSLATSVIF